VGLKHSLNWSVGWKFRKPKRTRRLSLSLHSLPTLTHASLARSQDQHSRRGELKFNCHTEWQVKVFLIRNINELSWAQVGWVRYINSLSSNFTTFHQTLLLSLRMAQTRWITLEDLKCINDARVLIRDENIQRPMLEVLKRRFKLVRVRECLKLDAHTHRSVDKPKPNF